jgi:hypothetical protein
LELKIACRKVPTPRASAKANTGQGNGLGIPPAEMLRKSQVKATTRISPQAKKPNQWGHPKCTGRLIHSLVKYTSPPPIIVTETRTGASTGAAHGTGIRNSRSQVSQESGQWSKNFRKA